MSDRRIVERLREWPLSEKLALEAAARIEALERDNAQLRKRLAEQWPQDAIDQEMIERTDDGWKLK